MWAESNWVKGLVRTELHDAFDVYIHNIKIHGPKRTAYGPLVPFQDYIHWNAGQIISELLLQEMHQFQA